VPGGEEDERHRRRLDEGEAARQRKDVAPRHDDELGAAAVAMLAEQTVARAEPVLPGEAAQADAARDAGAEHQGAEAGLDVVDAGPRLSTTPPPRSPGTSGSGKRWPGTPLRTHRSR
jgi:hypothetical protein